MSTTMNKKKVQQYPVETLDKPEDCSSSEQSTPLPEPNNNDIVLPSTNNRYNINQFDVSLAFYTFQLIASNNFDTINIESNVSHILQVFIYQKKK